MTRQKTKLRDMLTNAWLYATGLAIVCTLLTWLGILCLLLAKWLHN